MLSIVSVSAQQQELLDYSIGIMSCIFLVIVRLGHEMYHYPSSLLFLEWSMPQASVLLLKFCRLSSKGYFNRAAGWLGFTAI